MIFDRTFKNKFIEYIAMKARSDQDGGSYVYKTIYNLIRSNKLVFNTNVSFISFDKELGKKSIDAINHAGQSFGVLGTRIHDKMNESNDNLLEGVLSKLNDLSERPPTIQDKKYMQKLGAAVATTGYLSLYGLSKLLRKPFEFRFDANIKLEGGYDTFRKQLLFKAWLYAGYNILDNKFHDLLQVTFAKILSACLYEGIFFYDYLNNGTLIQSDIVKEWYKTYFTNTCMQFTGRTTAAKIFGNILGELWPKALFNNVEKYILLNKEPPLIQKLISGRSKSFTDKDTSLEDNINDEVFGEALKQISEIDIDNDTREKLIEYWSSFMEFFLFMYKNRSQKLNPEFIAKELTTDMSTKSFDSRLLGFKIFGEADNFDKAYNVLGLKKIYKFGQSQFFKRNLIYSELYMPTTIIAKRMYFSTLAGESEPFDLQLLDYALKGLSSIDKL